MVLGRMVYNFTSSAKILGVKAWRFGLYFVLLDIAFVHQIPFPKLCTNIAQEPSLSKQQEPVWPPETT